MYVDVWFKYIHVAWTKLDIIALQGWFLISVSLFPLGCWPGESAQPGFGSKAKILNSNLLWNGTNLKFSTLAGLGQSERTGVNENFNILHTLLYKERTSIYLTSVLQPFQFFCIILPFFFPNRLVLWLMFHVSVILKIWEESHVWDLLISNNDTWVCRGERRIVGSFAHWTLNAHTLGVNINDRVKIQNVSH